MAISALQDWRFADRTLSSCSCSKTCPPHLTSRNRNAKCRKRGSQRCLQASVGTKWVLRNALNDQMTDEQVISLFDYSGREIEGRPNHGLKAPSSLNIDALVSMSPTRMIFTHARSLS